jgi:hypothetical protein
MKVTGINYRLNEGKRYNPAENGYNFYMKSEKTGCNLCTTI